MARAVAIQNVGVAETTILGRNIGPLLYTIFTNYLSSVLCKATVQMYADDSTLYHAAKTVSELDNVLSAVKSKSIILGSSHKLSSIPKMSLNLSGEPVEQVK